MDNEKAGTATGGEAETPIPTDELSERIATIQTAYGRVRSASIGVEANDAKDDLGELGMIMFAELVETQKIIAACAVDQARAVAEVRAETKAVNEKTKERNFIGQRG